ncbi:hypothetical protein Bbad01_02770 [Bacillus badius]|nr:hypothetical protein Bbad01_02770 [Bacillus badius]
MYHITSRDNWRAALFYDDSDQEAYLNILEEVRTHLSLPFIITLITS